METVKVVRLEAPSLNEAAGVLARAFRDDPMLVHMFPFETDRERGLRRFQRIPIRYCHLYGKVFTTEAPLRGLAAWLPPGAFRKDPVHMLRSGMLTAPFVLGWSAFRRLMEITGPMERLRRDLPHERGWHLWTLGVDPPCQGQGIGSALLRHGLEMTDAAGQSCHLATMKPDNVAFYLRHGFRVAADAEVFQGGPHAWIMVREPR